MKYITFKRESNTFADILGEAEVKKIYFRFSWTCHLILGVSDDNESVVSYLMMKYGDDIISDVVPDRSPRPGVDYMPKR